MLKAVMLILSVNCVSDICFETEVANKRARFYRKLVMLNSPLFISKSNDYSLDFFVCIELVYSVFCTLYIVLCCHFGETKFIYNFRNKMRW